MNQGTDRFSSSQANEEIFVVIITFPMTTILLEIEAMNFFLLVNFVFRESSKDLRQNSLLLDFSKRLRKFIYQKL